MPEHTLMDEINLKIPVRVVSGVYQGVVGTLIAKGSHEAFVIIPNTPHPARQVTFPLHELEEIVEEAHPEITKKLSVNP